MSFSLAVAVPINNFRFDTPTFVSATLTQVASANDISVKLTQVYPTSAEALLTTLLRRGDVLTLTSSVTATSGFTEQVEVERIDDSDNTVYFKEKLSYSYMTGDSAKGYGTGIPEGWILGTKTLTGISESTIKPIGGGYSSDYGFYATMINYNNDANTFPFIAMRDWDIDPWLECCWYRQGIFVKGLTYHNDSRFFLSAYDGRINANTGAAVGVNSFGFKEATPNNVAWEEKTQTFITGENLTQYNTNVSSIRPRTGNVAFLAYVAPHTGTDRNYVWFTISDMYLEHIRGIAPITQSLVNIPSTKDIIFVYTNNPSDFTVGNLVNIWGFKGFYESREVVSTTGKIETVGSNFLAISGFSSDQTFVSGAMIEEVNGGVYTFEEYPDLGVEWAPRKNVSVTPTTNNNLKYFNLSGWGERSTKVDIKMQFTNVGYTFYKKLRKFEEYCERGEMLNLHLTDDLPELGRKFIQCFIKLEGFKHEIWNRERCSFTLQASEC
jgi:hypothetical protein